MAFFHVVSVMVLGLLESDFEFFFLVNLGIVWNYIHVSVPHSGTVVVFSFFPLFSFL